MITGHDVIAEARKWVGVPYLHQGRNRNGIDCIGLPIMVARALGLSEFDVTGYGESPDPVWLRRLADEHMTPCPSDELGCVLLFRLQREPQHFAIRTEHGMITAIGKSQQMRRVLEVRLNLGWQSRLVASYRLPGVSWPN